MGSRPWTAASFVPHAACRMPHAACASCVPLQSLTHITCAGPLHGNPGVFSECGATAFARPLCPLVSPGGDVCVCSGGCECAWRMRVRVCVACEDASMRRAAVLVRTCLGRRVCVCVCGCEKDRQCACGCGEARGGQRKIREGASRLPVPLATCKGIAGTSGGK